jgi:polyferredoxin
LRNPSLRWISQLFFLIFANLGAFRIKTGFCYPFFYCNSCPAATSACPIRPVEVGLKDSNWRLILYPFLIIGAVGVVSGRAVCGWACPIGMLQRATGSVPRHIKKKYPKVKKLADLRIDNYLRYLKYVIFILLVFVTVVLIGFMFTDICPVGFLVGTIPISILFPGEYVPNEYFYAKFMVFILFIALIFIIERGWCRYFCPVGAMLAPFNKVSMYKVEVNEDKCIHCNACKDVCPMGIDVPNMDRDLECIFCGKCISICPTNAINYRRPKINA